MDHASLHVKLNEAVFAIQTVLTVNRSIVFWLYSISLFPVTVGSWEARLAKAQGEAKGRVSMLQYTVVAFRVVTYRNHVMGVKWRVIIEGEESFVSFAYKYIFIL